MVQTAQGALSLVVAHHIIEPDDFLEARSTASTPATTDRP
jgi:hypothetical protein